MEGLRRRIEETARLAGLDRVGFAGTEPFPEVEASMRRRIDNGMSAGLGFTYRDPGTATAPRVSFPWGRTLVVGARAYLPESGSPDSTESEIPTGRVSRVAAGDGYEPLRRGLEAIADLLVVAGYRAEVLCDDHRLVDRAAAVR
ncbi:MAG TPA: hypothetical protein VJQ79_01915, partial [Acidimicrobiia bacterium]|nr:hypothetical protein [Acidimicrobiia bacterium]